jgi:hypothetical protein
MLALRDNVMINKINCYQKNICNEYNDINGELKKELMDFTRFSIFDVKGIFKKLGRMLGFYTSRENTHLDEARKT